MYRGYNSSAVKVRQCITKCCKEPRAEARHLLLNNTVMGLTHCRYVNRESTLPRTARLALLHTDTRTATHCGSHCCTLYTAVPQCHSAAALPHCYCRMYAATLLHTAAQPHSYTLLRALLHTAVRTATQCREHCHTSPNCRNITGFSGNLWGFSGILRNLWGLYGVLWDFR